jgi:glutamine amidotransferase
VTVPTNSTLTIYKQTVMIHPIIDKFYSPNPAHSRSAQFAQTKGQTITGPDKTVISQPVAHENSGAATPNYGVAKDKLDAAMSRLRAE